MNPKVMTSQINSCASEIERKRKSRRAHGKNQQKVAHCSDQNVTAKEVTMTVMGYCCSWLLRIRESLTHPYDTVSWCEKANPAKCNVPLTAARSETFSGKIG